MINQNRPLKNRYKIRRRKKPVTKYHPLSRKKSLRKNTNKWLKKKTPKKNKPNKWTFFVCNIFSLKDINLKKSFIRLKMKAGNLKKLEIEILKESTLNFIVRKNYQNNLRRKWDLKKKEITPEKKKKVKKKKENLWNVFVFNLLIEKNLDERNSFKKLFFINFRRKNLKESFKGKSDWYKKIIYMMIEIPEISKQTSFWKLRKISKNAQLTANRWYEKVIKKFVFGAELNLKISFWKLIELSKRKKKNLILYKVAKNLKTTKIIKKHNLENLKVRETPTKFLLEKIEKVFPNTLYTNTIKFFNKKNIQIEEYLKKNIKIVKAEKNPWFRKIIKIWSLKMKINFQISFFRLKLCRRIIQKKNFPSDNFWFRKVIGILSYNGKVGTLQNSFWKIKKIYEIKEIEFPKNNFWFKKSMFKILFGIRSDLQISFWKLREMGKIFKKKKSFCWKKSLGNLDKILNKIFDSEINHGFRRIKALK